MTRVKSSERVGRWTSKRNTTNAYRMSFPGKRNCHFATRIECEIHTRRLQRAREYFCPRCGAPRQNNGTRASRTSKNRSTWRVVLSKGRFSQRTRVQRALWISCATGRRPGFVIAIRFVGNFATRARDASLLRVVDESPNPGRGGDVLLKRPVPRWRDGGVARVGRAENPRREKYAAPKTFSRAIATDFLLLLVSRRGEIRLSSSLSDGGRSRTIVAPTEAH